MLSKIPSAVTVGASLGMGAVSSGAAVGGASKNNSAGAGGGASFGTNTALTAGILLLD